MIFDRSFDDGNFRFIMTPEGNNISIKLINRLQNDEIVKEYLTDDEESAFAIFDALFEIYNQGMGIPDVYNFTIEKTMSIQYKRDVKVIKE